jgi:predicted O-methyltransferase YrrM
MMRVLDALRRGLRNSDVTAQSLREIVAGVANETEVLNRKFGELIAAIGNQTDLLNRKFAEVSAAVANQSNLLNRKLGEVSAAVANQSNLLDRKLDHLSASAAGQPPPAMHVNRRATGDGVPVPDPIPVPDGLQAPPRGAAPVSFREAMGQMPLMIADRTYNTSHPDYDARLVRNFPGKIFNRDRRCDNPAFAELLKSAVGDEIADATWTPILEATLAEAKTVPHAEQVFERRAFIENYVVELERKYKAYYQPGWVNLDDALFLYWLVRQTKPKKIVQCGVCNGLSASFMMLALAKNGPDGTLSVIDLAPVFDPDDPAWTVENKVYGVVIPEGKTTGWMVPDAYRDRFEVWNGDAKELLPKMVDKVDHIDLFYHDSDHTYDHMMFEFREAKQKLTPGGLIVGDDVSWNTSVWDFADEYGVPSYNYKGAVGVAFF